ncbi:hypothetical protein Tco_1024310 [Tanacetum coccineum]
MASMNTRLNIEKLDGYIVQKHEGSKQVRFKQLGPGVETRVNGVHDEKRVWFEVELQGPQGDREAEVFQVNNDDTAVAQKRLEDKQPEEKINTDCLVKEQEKEYQSGWKIKTGNVLDSCNQRNMCFNESGEYKKTFIGSGVGTGSVQVLQGDEFEVEPQEDHTFEVEPHVNVDHVAGSQKLQTQVAKAEKIYAHESLTFNYTVACEVIFKWKARMKDDIDARSDVYVLSNGCRRCSDDSNSYYWEYTPGDCDVKKNDVGILNKFDRGLQTDVQVFMDFDYAMGRSNTNEVQDTYGGYKGGYLAKGTRNRVMIRAKDSSGYCYRCIVKGYPWFEVPALVEAAAYRRFLI